MLKEIWVDNKKYVVDVSYYNSKEKVSSRALLEEAKKHKNDCEIIYINPDYVISPTNIIIAIQYALRAFKRGKNISRLLPIEVMLYLAGEREISKALRFFRIKEITDKLIIAIIGETTNKVLTVKAHLMKKFSFKESKIEVNREKIDYVKNLYKISREEISTTYASSEKEALVKLVAIRSAFLSIS